MISKVQSQLTVVSPGPPGRRPEPLWEQRGFLEVVLICVCCLVFISTIGFGFVYDDRGQILENPYLRSWSYFGHYFTSHVWAQTNRPAVYYRPIFLCWLRLNYAVFRTRAWGWHMMSVLAHVAVTLLVFRLALRLLQSRWQAAITGLLFAVHPLHVESVAWVSGVVDPLFSIFFLASLLCYVRWRERRGAGCLAAALGLGFLAMLSKEPGITLPAIVFVFEWIFARSTAPGESWQRFRTAAARALPFVLVAGTYLGVRHAVLKTTGPIYSSVSTALVAIPGLVLFYLRLVIWPSRLSLFYDRQYSQHLTLGEFLIPLVLLALVAVAAMLLLRRSPRGRQAAFSAAFVAILLSPVLWVQWLPDNNFVHDRYLYLPLAGFSMLAAIAITGLGGKPISERLAPPRQLLALAGILVPLIVLNLIAQTYWHDDLALWTHCFRTAPQNRQVLNNLASSLGARGEYDKSVALFEQVLRQNPNDGDVQGNLGYTFYLTGALNSAEQHLNFAVQLDPSNVKALFYLGLTHYKLGLLDLAGSELRRVITLDPSREGVHLALSLVLEQQGDLAAAIRETNAELAYYPDEKLAKKRLNQLQAGQH